MSKYYKFLILLSLCALLGGCQPTPEKPVIVQKNELDQQIMQTAAPSSSEETEDTWQETIEQDGVKVNINAAVEIPDVASWPVIEVSPYGFTEQDAQKVVDVFLQGQPFYEVNSVKSKADIEQDIIWVNQQLEKAKTDENLSVDGLNALLKQYQEGYDNAPDTISERKNGKIEFKRNPDSFAEVSRSIAIEADLKNSFSAYVFAGLSDDNLYSVLSFGTKYDHPTNYFPFYTFPDTVPGMTISREEALQTAQDVLEKMVLTDVQLSGTQLRVDVECLTWDSYAKAMTDPDKDKCFLFQFARTVNGIPVTCTEFTNGIIFDDNGETYDRVWGPEIIEIAVGNNGVLWFDWNNPGTIGQTLNTNVQLKDFQEIKDIFKKQLFYEKAWSIPSEKSELSIKRVVLGLMRVKMEGGQYVYMPVWDFIGDWEDSGIMQTNMSFLTLNAVDGSVIDRSLGY